MNLNEVEDFDNEGSLDKVIIQSLKKQLGGNKEIYVKLIDKRPGKNGKINIVKQTINGDIIDIDDDQPEPVSEGVRDTLKIGAVCFILASGVVSCKKEGYNIGKDARYRLKPNILNSLGKNYFDSPVENKDKIYVWAGNQNGASTPTRYIYLDFTNQEKRYGEVYGDEYPDSTVSKSSSDNTTNTVTPSLVVNVLPFNIDILPKIQEYNKTGIQLDSLLGKYRNVVVIEVLGSTRFDWTDIYNPKEVGTGRKTGYAIYLTNLPSINVGELYPKLMDELFNTHLTSKGNDKILPLDNYMKNSSENLLGDKPEL